MSDDTLNHEGALALILQGKKVYNVKYFPDIYVHLQDGVLVTNNGELAVCFLVYKKGWREYTEA